MGMTIEDMLTISKDKYKMEMIAGQNGWSNSISWVLLIEDSLILRNFKGKDLAVTTGLGFDTEEKLMDLVENLVTLHASGLVINTGMYIIDIPESIIRYCNENDFPLLTIPWSTQIYDMIKDLSMRVLMQSAIDEQIANALIHIIKDPELISNYAQELLPYIDIDGDFQVILMTTGDLDVMDTVERRRIAYQMQINLENITHNGHFFYYDSCFVLVTNDVKKNESIEIVNGFVSRAKRRMPGKPIFVGVGSIVTTLGQLQTSYKRAKIAVEQGLRNQKRLTYFDEMGFSRLLSMVTDQGLFAEMGTDLLAPLIEYDSKHDSEYVDILFLYLESGGSIQSVANQTFMHRNTVIYRMNNIKKLLQCDLEQPNDRFKYYIACLIYRYKQSI